MKRPRSNDGCEGCEAFSREGLRGVQYFVLDEADRLLDMGFMPQVRDIVNLMGTRPPTRQCLMFSATWPPPIRALAQEFLSGSPVRVFADQAESDEPCANQNVTQVVEIHRETRKDVRLFDLLHQEGSGGKCLIFVNTKKGAAALAQRIRSAGFACGEIHGNLFQADRVSNLADFTCGSKRILVATDLAARGIDVDDISLVVNYDFPDSMVGGLEDYVHRIGRTGRAGRMGRAVTFFPAPEDVSGTRSAGNAHELIKILRSAGQTVPQELADLDQGPLAAKDGKGYGKGTKQSKSTWKGAVTASRSESNSERPAKLFKSAHGVSIEGFADGAAPDPILHFASAPFGRKVLAEFESSGFQKPTAIQAYGWPAILTGRDCIGIAKTGSGKTLAFLLPAFKRVRKLLKNVESTGSGPIALVVAPTRELAVQIHGEAERFAKVFCLRTVCAYGGAAWEPQAALLEAGVELLVATPGRLAFLMCRGGEAAATLARTIASCGSLKQLANASAAFEEFLAKGGSPTRRIFATYINAHVLSGDLGGAARVASQMEESGFCLGVVEYTTLLKGELAAGNMTGAQKIIQTMLGQDQPVTPDVRAVNTFLRGCLKLGETPAAADFYQHLEEWGVHPDAATYKILVSLFCQSLRLKDARSVLKKLECEESDAYYGLDNAVALNLCTAQAACLLGKGKLAARALCTAEKSLLRESESQTQFDKLRRQELAQEAKLLRSCLDEEKQFDLIGAFRRMFAFPAERCSSNCTPATVYSALGNSFGIRECFRLDMCSEEAFQRKYLRCFHERTVLNWSRIFGTKGLPTKLEVCSGSGDWVVAQAQAEGGSANWVASELRYDRAHSIFTKMVLAGTSNLSVLAGDAGSILHNHVPPLSLALVCVNFPEPPMTTRNASCEEAESQLHLLTPGFFRDVHLSLVEAGILTIFTDNQDYAMSLARTLGDLCKDGARMFSPIEDAPLEHPAEQENGMLVFQGTPGPEAGHVVAAASQFDRFFQHGQHCERYYISVFKV